MSLTNFKSPSDITFSNLHLHVHKVHSRLKDEADLSPNNPIVNSMLTRLFNLTVGLTDATEIAAQNDFVASFPPSFIKDFRNLLARSEEQMEYHWSKKLTNNETISYETLSDFIYWQNYKNLVDQECALLAQHTSQTASTCFVGQGPLPISMAIYQQQTKAPCVGVDISAHATCHSCALFKALKAENCVCILQDGAKYDFKDAEIVFIASLIPDKEKIVNKIKRDRGDKTTFIMIRSAENLSEIYYEPYKNNDEVLNYLGKTPYSSEAVNTTLLYRYN